MKRFWREVTVAELPGSGGGGGWQIALDGRALRTQGGQPQVLPTRALADRLAGEWAAQGEEVDPAGFAGRDMADFAIDVIAADRTPTIDRLMGYAETDTLCYRADPDEPLFKRQWGMWEPLLAAFEAREGVAFERVSGIVHRAQPAATLTRLRARVEALGPFTLAPLDAMTSLAASLTIGLSALEPDADLAALWDAAELEEAWQVEQWGNDALAQARREKRRAGFLAAAAFAAAARG